MPSQISRVALTDQVYNLILENIFNQAYEPGQRLNVSQIAKSLNVSTTPVREALGRLASERLIEQTSFKGFQVAREMDMQSTNELFDVRILLETHAIQLTRSSETKRLAEFEATLNSMRDLVAGGISSSNHIQEFNDHDRKFHRLVVEASGNHFLIIAYDSLESHIHLGRLYLRNRAVIDAQSIVDEHAAVLDCYRQGHIEQAVDALTQHINAARDRVLSLYRSETI
jgi:DNA-binding GntR family transcriptional regulator